MAAISLDNVAENALILRCVIHTGLFELVASENNENILIKPRNSKRCYTIRDFMKESAFYHGMKDGLKGNGFNNPYDHNDNLFPRIKAREYNLGYLKGKKYAGQFQLGMQSMKRKWN